ncbi:MAG: hypothetical protein NZ604_04540, partial [Flavobacteriales bacterium]|nr:hypothetical protein [Flavobacteriales bacterium]
ETLIDKVVDKIALPEGIGDAPLYEPHKRKKKPNNNNNNNNKKRFNSKYKGKPKFKKKPNSGNKSA